MTIRYFIIAAILFVAGVFASNQSAHAKSRIDKLLQTIKIPPGFSISLFAEVPGARSMVMADPLKAMFVGSRGSTIYMIRDYDKKAVAGKVERLSGSLNVPNGIAFDGKSLYVAEQHRIAKWPLSGRLTSLPPLDPIMEELPDRSWHGWRYAAFGPDGKLYVSVGAPCNVCTVRGYEGTIIRLGRDGGNIEVVARGVRNSVGFDWHPKTKELFFTDNGSDGMGDDIPADELNNVTKTGQFFGFPYYGGGWSRTGHGGGNPPANSVPPVIEFQAHTANLGIHFYTGTMFPTEYKNDAFVAQHGSWNRSSKVGYRIMRIRFNDKGQAIGKEVFAEGWLIGESAWGRPVDIKMMKDGSLLVADDSLGVIYRITYGDKK